jgi:hypothetical protein
MLKCTTTILVIRNWKAKYENSRHQAKDFHEEVTKQSKLYKSTCTKEQQNDCMCDLVYSSTSYPWEKLKALSVI